MSIEKEEKLIMRKSTKGEKKIPKVCTRIHGENEK